MSSISGTSSVTNHTESGLHGLGNVAATVAKSAAGALIGGRLAYRKPHHDYDFSGLAVLPGAALGAVAGPLLIDAVVNTAKGGMAGGARGAGASLKRSMAASAPLLGAAAIGATVGGHVTQANPHSPYIDLSALPGALAGAVVGPALWAGTRAMAGSPGAWAAVAGASAVALGIKRGSHR